MKLGISNIAWAAKDRLKYYELLKKEKFIGLEIAHLKFFLYNHKNFLKPSKDKIKKNLNEIKKYNFAINIYAVFIIPVKRLSLIFELKI